MGIIKLVPTDDIYSNKLPFRPAVGMVIINKAGKIFIAKRLGSSVSDWQMPQGGILLGETPSSAAMREMEEEIGTGKGKIIAESKNWYSYNVPKSVIPKLWNGKYCGQRQKWFLIEYLGSDNDIKLDTEIPEFSEWQWIEYRNFMKTVMPLKRKLYSNVLKEFANLIELRTKKENKFIV